MCGRIVGVELQGSTDGGRSWCNDQELPVFFINDYDVLQQVMGVSTTASLNAGIPPCRVRARVLVRYEDGHFAQVRQAGDES